MEPVKVDLEGLTAEYAAPILAAAPSGLYRLDMYAYVTGAATSGTIRPSIIWRDRTSGRDVGTGDLDAGEFGNKALTSLAFYHASPGDISLDVQFLAVVGDPTYDVHAVLTKLS